MLRFRHSKRGSAGPRASLHHLLSLCRLAGGDLADDARNCSVSDLFLRSSAGPDGTAQPITLYPENSDAGAMGLSYRATMDYGMQGFDVETRVVPSTWCRLEPVSNAPTLVDPGSYTIMQLLMEDLRHGSESAARYQTVSINVNRLSGKETNLYSLRVDGASAFQPSWLPERRAYDVYLDVAQDIIKVIFERLDNGQVVEMQSDLEQPQVASVRLLQDIGPSYPLVQEFGPPIGEQQMSATTLLSTIDVGNQRSVSLIVTSADSSKHDRYILKVQRNFCPPELRFFDGSAKLCTDICNEGYFGNLATGRCSLCFEDSCAACDAGEAHLCSVCVDGFTLQNGKCVAFGVPNGLQVVQGLGQSGVHYAQRHQLLVVGGTASFIIAFCACALLVSSQQKGIRRRPRLLDSDDDLDAYDVDEYS